MPAIIWLQCLALASSSRAWPAPTMLNLMAVKLELGNEYNDQNECYAAHPAKINSANLNI